MVGGMTAMRAPLIAALLAVAFSACGLPGEAGIDLPRQHDGESYPGDRSHISGNLDVASNGCLNIATDRGTRLVIWPEGSESVEVGRNAGVKLSDGRVIEAGDAVSGVGAFTPTAPLVENRDGYWAHAIGFCAPGAADVVVLDSIDR